MTSFSWQRAVVKVGSSLIAPDGKNCSGQFLLAIARFITASREQGKEVILVSSGSVAAGRGKIAFNQQPSIAEKQAMAAIGQTQMMANWARFFDFPCAQLLLTAEDLRDRTRYVNIKNTLRELLNNHALPIVNENDTVAINELKVGDNDNLAAYTALVSQADTLIICSDIDGLYDAHPKHHANAKLISTVEHVSDDILALGGDAGSEMGTGGMLTKLQAAKKCSESGVQTLIVNGRSGQVFDELLEGKVPGTIFTAQDGHDNARNNWLKHTLLPKGEIAVDAGAFRAIVERGASLLPSGIVSVSGKFKVGDALNITHNKQCFAKGLALYHNQDLSKIQGQQSDKIQEVLGYTLGEAVIHRDDLVLI